MTTLDRMFFVNFVRSYVIVLTCLLTLYTILDLFSNLDDFGGQGFAAMVQRIGFYYGTRLPQIFDRLSEAISLLAAVFCVAWMQRNNELLPQLSAGVSTRRVLRPVLVGAGLTLTLGPVVQEFVIPRLADELTTDRDDPDMRKPTQVHGTYGQDGLHVEGVAAFRTEQKVFWFFVTFPETGPTGMLHLSAKEAQYVPPAPGVERSGGWMLFNTEPWVIDRPLPPGLAAVSPGQFFLKTTEIDFETVTRPSRWHLYASTPELRRVLARPDSRRQPSVAVAFHMRLTRPIVGVLLLLLGLARILQNPNQNIFISAGLCLATSAVFFLAVYGCKYLGENDYLTPPLAAWLPVIVFGPLALVLFDAIHT